MALDLKAWLIEMGVPAVKADDIVPSLGDAAITANIEKYGLRQSDYSKQMDAVKAKETALTEAQGKLDEANERLNLEMVEWAETQRGGGEITEKMRNDLAKAQGEVTRLTSVITTKAQELGLDPKTVIGEVPVPEVKPVPAAAPNLDGYVTDARLGQVGRYLMTLPAELEDIAQEHFELTGERLSRKAIVQEIEARGQDKLNRNPDGTFKRAIDARAIWEEKYDIPAKRQAAATAKHDAEIKAAEERGYERSRTEAALPGQQPIGRHSPVLKEAGNAREAGSVLKRPTGAAHADHISKAASALATHKYRTGGQPAGGRG